MIGSQNSGMGTEIEGKGYGYYSMRDVNNNSNNEQSSGNNWPLPSNREYVDNGFSHRNVVEFDKNTLRQTMLEHEAIFKRHVAELHCLYKIQRDMMNEVRRKDVHKQGMMMIPLEAVPSSSSPFSAWNSPLSGTKGAVSHDGLKDCEILDHRPSKVRKRLFDLQFTPDEEEGDCSYDASKRGGKLNLNADASNGFVFLADLNEPTQAEETESFSCQIETKSKSEFLRILSKETSRRDEEDAIRSNGKRYWPYAENCKNGPISSSSHDATQTMGFLQSEFHGRKNNPFGVINNHKIDWSQNQTWGKSIQYPSTPLQTYSSRAMTNSQLCGHSQEMLKEKWQFQTGPTSNLCFSSPLAANNHLNNGFYRGSSSGSKDAIACFPPVVRLDHMNAIDKGRKQDHHPHLPSWLKPNSDFKPKNPNYAEMSFQQSSLLGNNTPPRPPPRKILGFTISDYPPPTSASLQSIPVHEDVKKEGKSRELIDINVAYYDPEAEENHKVRTHIDLNSCITEEEEEDPPMEPIKRNLLGPKFSMEIDLEAPPLPDEEEEEVNMKIAAEAIVCISVSAHCHCPDEENSMEDPLGWFAEIVVPNSLFCEETIMDHFEAITLSLPEMKQEEYMPKEVIIIPSNYEEESGTMVVNKNQTRRSRRGRQKRDFQRDILPGLVSLSRHEVSEDIQTFSGLMKATGRTWQSGLTRGRRRRFVVEPDPMPRAEEEVNQSLLEVGGGGSSLTVWGKTLRRPRRQRCPAIANLNQNPNKKIITIASNSNNSIISS